MLTSRWYAVHAYSNFENKVVSRSASRPDSAGSRICSKDILVPKEKVVDQSGAAGKSTRSAILPEGYVLVKMELTPTRPII